MSLPWQSRKSEERGAYTTVAQTEETSAAHRMHRNQLDHEDHEDQDPDPENTALEDSTPTPEDLALLPRVADELPYGVFLVAIVELCERFAYYGLSGPFQNYAANKYHDANGLPGALGLGQSGATALTNFFQVSVIVSVISGIVK